MRKTIKKIIGFFLAIRYRFVFKLVDSFEFTVPDSYVGDRQFEAFASYRESNLTEFYDYDLAKFNWEAARGLIPGKTYRINIFSIIRRAKFKECLNFLSMQRAIFSGVHILCLILQFGKNRLPINQWILSFDEENCKDEVEGSNIPFLCCYRDGAKAFAQVNTAVNFNSGYCLLCVRDLSATT